MLPGVVPIDSTYCTDDQAVELRFEGKATSRLGVYVSGEGRPNGDVTSRWSKES